MNIATAKSTFQLKKCYVRKVNGLCKHQPCWKGRCNQVLGLVNFYRLMGKGASNGMESHNTGSTVTWGPLFLQVHKTFMVTPCCGLKRVQMFMQHAWSRVMTAWGTCMFYYSQQPKKVPSAHTGGETGRRAGSAGSRTGRHVSLTSQVECRAQTNKPSWVCAGSAWPSEALTCHPSQVRLGCCKKGQDQAVHYLAQKGYLMRVWCFFLT